MATKPRGCRACPEALAVAAYRLTRTSSLSPARALAACLKNYRPPVAIELILTRMQLAAEEATDASFVPESVQKLLL